VSSVIELDFQTELCFRLGGVSATRRLHKGHLHLLPLSFNVASEIGWFVGTHGQSIGDGDHFHIPGLSEGPVLHTTLPAIETSAVITHLFVLHDASAAQVKRIAVCRGSARW
jgi:hypothetical protein